jgi:hypothetical protein
VPGAGHAPLVTVQLPFAHAVVCDVKSPVEHAFDHVHVSPASAVPEHEAPGSGRTQHGPSHGGAPGVGVTASGGPFDDVVVECVVHAAAAAVATRT